jgi:hypothetical protein
MKTRRIVNGVMVSLAAVGFLLPQPLLAAKPAPASPAIDVALRDGGLLVGQVVDEQGAALGNVPVSLRYQDRQLVAGKTNKDGSFGFNGLRGGVYQIVAAKGHGVYRVWTVGTAPPAAQDGALVVSGDPVVRGQAGGGFAAFITNPLVIAGVVATAIAVPVAIHNSRHRSAESN